jgi:hypothetical protein
METEKAFKATRDGGLFINQVAEGAIFVERRG